MDYEEAVNHSIASYKSFALCTYPVSRCSPKEIIDVVNRHQFSLFKTNEGWMLYQSPPPLSENTLKQSFKHAEETKQDTSFQILSTYENERKKIAISLHSSVGTLALAMNSKLSAVEKAIKALCPDLALKSLAEIRSTLQNEVRKIKKLSYNIHPPELDFGGLPDAVKSCFFSTARERNINFLFEVDPACPPLSDQEATVLFRIANEAFNNALKHSGARTLEMCLTQADAMIRFSIQDDGCGFDLNQVSKHPERSLGLLGMKEMAKSLGGIFEIKSSPGKGTRIQVFLPCSNQKEL